MLGFQRPTTLSAVTREYMQVERSIGFPIAEFLDEFYTNPERRAAMLVEEPPLVTFSREPTETVEQINAYIGAIAEYLATKYKIPVPSWVEKPERFLAEPYYFGVKDPALIAWQRKVSPPAFARRNIFTEDQPLRRARMPRNDGEAKFPPGRTQKRLAEAILEAATEAVKAAVAENDALGLNSPGAEKGNLKTRKAPRKDASRFPAAKAG